MPIAAVFRIDEVADLLAPRSVKASQVDDDPVHRLEKVTGDRLLQLAPELVLLGVREDEGRPIRRDPAQVENLTLERPGQRDPLPRRAGVADEPAEPLLDRRSDLPLV